jgi:hypothetical protein
MSNYFLSGKNKNGKKLTDELFFDALYKAIIGNNGRGDYNEISKTKAVVQSFLQKPRNILQKKIQAFTGSTDLPLLTGEPFVITVDQTAYDLGYEQAFAEVSPVKGKLFWTVIAGHNSLTFLKVPEGGRIVTAGKTGDRVTFQIDKYGGALGWTWEAIEGRETYSLIQDALIFRNRFYETKANVFYMLLQAAAATNAVTVYDTGTDGQLRRDIRTINQAIYDLTFRLRDKGYGDMANAPVIIYANRSLENRFKAAIRATTDAMATQQTGAEEITSRPVTVIYTYNQAITANRPIVCVPGITITRQDYMMPTTYTAPTDVLTLNGAQAVWAAYGGGIGDSEQCQNFLLT